MKNIIIATSIITLCTAITLQATITHTFINDTDLPIQISVLYHVGTHSDTHRIEPHTSYTFDARAGGIQVKRVDLRDANKNKMIVQAHVSNNTEANGLSAIGSTKWRFYLMSPGNAELKMISGGQNRSGQGKYRVTTYCSNNQGEYGCVRAADLP